MELLRHLLRGIVTKPVPALVETPWDITDQRLYLTTYFGEELTQRLQQPESVPEGNLSTAQREKLTWASERYSEISISSFPHQPEPNMSAAYVLRVLHPRLIIGKSISPSDDLSSIIHTLAKQLGLPPGMASADNISDRLSGRDGVAVVFINIQHLTVGDRAKLLDLARRFPVRGVLIIA